MINKKCNVLLVVILLLISQTALSRRYTKLNVSFKNRDISSVLFILGLAQQSIHDDESIYVHEDSAVQMPLSAPGIFCNDSDVDIISSDGKKVSILSKNYMPTRILKIC